MSPAENCLNFFISSLEQFLFTNSCKKFYFYLTTIFFSNSTIRYMTQQNSIEDYSVFCIRKKLLMYFFVNLVKKCILNTID